VRMHGRCDHHKPACWIRSISVKTRIGDDPGCQTADMLV